MNKVTIKDIAKIAGVSHATVSKALNDKDGVGIKSKNKILKIAKSLNYTPNIAAQRLSHNTSKTIGFVLPESKSSFFFHLARALESLATQNNINVFVSMSAPEQALKSFRGNLVDFVVMWLFPNDSPSPLLLQEKENFNSTLTILGGGHLLDSNIIDIDRVSGIYSAVNHLVDLSHKKISYIGEDCDKFKGYCLAMAKHNLSDFTQKSIILPHLSENKFKENSIYLHDEFCALYEKHRPTAVILDSQSTALMLLKTFYELKLDIPKDISIICYDDIPELSLYPTELTTCAPSIEDICNEILSLFQKHISNGTICNHYNSITPSLFVRNSTKKYK